jgi:hypothetical protein
MKVQYSDYLQKDSKNHNNQYQAKVQVKKKNETFVMEMKKIEYFQAITARDKK